MKKIGIITLNGNFNYGNKLQNYALITLLNKRKCKTIWLIKDFSMFVKEQIIINFLFFLKKYHRNHSFGVFNKKYIKPYYCFSYNKINRVFRKFIVGSDQVWNPNFPGIDSSFFLSFSPYEKNISYAASFGVNDIPKERIEEFTNGLNNIKYISTREERGKEIIKELTGRTDVEVLLDPTMLLTSEEWDKVSKKPKQLKSKKYILNYFLGNFSDRRRQEIEKTAKENNCDIINLLDPKDPLYSAGPSEFLYLEKHAFLICTDSFHASVFAILYDKPFIVFDREESGVESMGSRLDTLLNKFQLENRKYNGNYILKENLEHDYTKSYKILEAEKEKSIQFLKKVLDIKDSESYGE